MACRWHFHFTQATIRWSKYGTTVANVSFKNWTTRSWLFKTSEATVLLCIFFYIAPPSCQYLLSIFHLLFAQSFHQCIRRVGHSLSTCGVYLRRHNDMCAGWFTCLINKNRSAESEMTKKKGFINMVLDVVDVLCPPWRLVNAKRLKILWYCIYY